ncbi:MAG: hypothetical protein ACK4RK_17705 [Gemmataceae bacterium]
MRWQLVFVTWLSLTLPPFAQVVDDQEKAEGFVSLFDGKSLRRATISLPSSVLPR